MTAYHTKSFTQELTKHCPSDSVGRLAACLTALLPASLHFQTLPHLTIRRIKDDTFRNVQRPGLRATCVLANP